MTDIPNSRRSPMEHERDMPDAQTDAPEQVWCKPVYNSWYSYGHWYDSETGGGVSYVRSDLHDAAQAEIAKLRKTNDIWRKNSVANHAAITTMRNDLNELCGDMPSMEGVLLDGPEWSHDCAAIAQAVSSCIIALRKRMTAAERNRREGMAELARMGQQMDALERAKVAAQVEAYAADVDAAAAAKDLPLGRPKAKQGITK